MTLAHLEQPTSAALVYVVLADLEDDHTAYYGTDPQSPTEKRRVAAWGVYQGSVVVTPLVAHSATGVLVPAADLPLAEYDLDRFLTVSPRY